MKNQVATQERNGGLKAQTQAAPPQKRESLIPELTPEAVRTSLCPRATDGEIAVFVNMCRSRRLNPFAGDAWLIKPEKSRDGKEYPAYWVIHFRKRIEPCLNHPKYERFKYGLILSIGGKIERRDSEFYLRDKEKILGAWCHIWLKGWPEPFIHEIDLYSWKKLKYNGEPQSMWKDNEAHMICKTVVTQGFSMVFAGLNLSNMPNDSEITNVMIEEAQVEQSALGAGKELSLQAGNEEGELANAEYPEEGDEFPSDDSGEISGEESEKASSETSGTDDTTITLEKLRELSMEKRRRVFFMFIRKEHGLSEDTEIKERVQKVLRLKEPPESLKAFIEDNELFFKWAEKDEFYFEDPAGDLFTDYARPKDLDND